MHELIFEIFIIICFTSIILDLIKNKDWHKFALLIPIVFTSLLFENIGVQRSVYIYPDFFVYIFNAPLSIAMAWAVIMYLVYFSSNKISKKISINKIFLYGLFALGIDLLIVEPFAILFGWWIWTAPFSNLIAPLSNYAYWFSICIIYLTLYDKLMQKNIKNYYRFLGMFLIFFSLLIPMILLYNISSWNYYFYVSVVFIYGMSVSVLLNKYEIFKSRTLF